MEEKIKSLALDLLKQLSIKPRSLTIVSTAADSYQLDLDLLPEDSGILIGYHGDTIASLQLILNLFLYHQTGSWIKLVVNIGDYRQKRAEALMAMAEDTVQKVLASGQPMALYNLNPFERRVIHTHLADNQNIVTQSQGEGRDRHLIIAPRTNGIPQP